MTTNVRNARSNDSTVPAATRTARLLIAATLLVVAYPEGGFSQTARLTSLSPSQASAGSASSDGKPQVKAETADAEKAGAANGTIDPRSKLLADTHLLLTLSRELQAEAAKTTPNTFSLRLVKKSEEIQKLAAEVRAEMAKLQ